MITGKFISQWLSLLLVAMLCVSCGPGRPERKKLPDAMSLNSWEGICAYTREYVAIEQEPFYYSDTVIAGQKFGLISLPFPQYDSLAWGIVKAYKAIPGNVLNMLLQENKKGTVIDFRGTGENTTNQAEFAITEQVSKNTATIIFLWDNNSFYRAEVFMSELKQLSSEIFTVVNSFQNSPDNKGCFQNSKPAFNN